VRTVPAPEEEMNATTSSRLVVAEPPSPSVSVSQVNLIWHIFLQNCMDNAEASLPKLESRALERWGSLGPGLMKACVNEYVDCIIRGKGKNGSYIDVCVLAAVDQAEEELRAAMEDSDKY
jgi:hypothetical protein